jgi:hypothetical protein
VSPACGIRFIVSKYFETVLASLSPAACVLPCVFAKSSPKLTLKEHADMKKAVYYLMFILTFALAAQAAQAQESDAAMEHPLEVGGQITFINLNGLDSIVTIPGAALSSTQFDQTYGSFGGRVGYNINRHFSIEAEGNFFPERNWSEIEQSRKAQFFAGVKAGLRSEKFGIFAKARPGLMHFSSLPSHTDCIGNTVANFTCREESQTNFALDLGGVLEFYPSKRTILRFDAGDTIVRFQDAGPTTFGTTSIFTPAATTHNFQAGVGFGFRF